MSEYRDIRFEFNRQAARNGWVTPADVIGQWPIPAEKWLRRFYKVPHFALDRQRRLVNHFKVGADPEFIFESIEAGVNGPRIDAQDLGLKAGLAFGADNNGRLVEVRPQPNRFVLATLASTWSTLKWMSILSPNTLQYSWRAGAYYANDGLGGHVHFGRRRPQHVREVAALDTIAFYMFHSGIWDADEGCKRIRQAQGGGPVGYGRLGDRRAQPYGYEYRTFPSHISSPWMNYFTMVLSKLAVHDPELLPPLAVEMEKLTPAQVRNRLVAILAYYKGLDDDAQLAYEIWSKQGFPAWSVSDLKVAWGILGTKRIQPPKVDVQVLPVCVPPLPEELTALAQAMLEGHPPEIVSIVPSWRPNKLPEGYIGCIQEIQTRHSPGLGELFADLCMHTNPEYRFTIDGPKGGALTIGGITKKMHPEWKELAAKFPNVMKLYGHYGQEKGPWLLSIAEKLRSNEHRDETRKFLTSGLWPIWKISDVKVGSLQEWKDRMLSTKPVVEAPKKAPKEYKFSKILEEKGGG